MANKKFFIYFRFLISFLFGQNDAQLVYKRNKPSYYTHFLE
ncbi:hypothetical protein FEM08_24480 [Flavobacterium gilvum]|nr:hypothetical protein FEM08_24480 [Flavobacterium gilvum]